MVSNNHLLKMSDASFCSFIIYQHWPLVPLGLPFPFLGDTSMMYWQREILLHCKIKKSSLSLSTTVLSLQPGLCLSRCFLGSHCFLHVSINLGTQLFCDQSVSCQFACRKGFGHLCLQPSLSADFSPCSWLFFFCIIPQASFVLRLLGIFCHQQFH